MVTEWLDTWARKRVCGDAVGGTLLWVDEEGGARDLGAYTQAELAGLVWAVTVAYRRTPDRYERTRLAAVREGARRLALGLRKS